MGVVSDGVMIAPAAGDSPVAVAGEGRRGRKGEASSIGVGVGLSSKDEQRGTARRHANCPPNPASSCTTPRPAGCLPLVTDRWGPRDGAGHLSVGGGLRRQGSAG